ncbi:MAG TPA: flagellar biosynthesis protein FliQ [Porticoccaceae bacterium]|nr:flagellar biosynthesis protein FliQ [Porticoccaceae bacterium]
MNPDTVVAIGQEALKITALVSAPVLVAVLITGLAISLFQAVTQINEMTLSFIPKLLVLTVVLVVSGTWMLDVLVRYTQRLFASIPGLIG